MNANNKHTSGNKYFQIYINIINHKCVTNIIIFKGSPKKRTEIISILKHNNDIILNSQLYNGNYKKKKKMELNII